MSNAALEKFGYILMRKVRDEAVTDWKMIIDGRMKGELAEKIRLILRGFSEYERKLLLLIIPAVVDTVLHHFLWTAEQNSDLQVAIRMEDDFKRIHDLSEGLPGELYSDEGWIARFSKEDRFLI